MAIGHASRMRRSSLSSIAKMGERSTAASATSFLGLSTIRSRARRSCTDRSSSSEPASASDTGIRSRSNACTYSIAAELVRRRMATCRNESPPSGRRAFSSASHARKRDAMKRASIAGPLSGAEPSGEALPSAASLPSVVSALCERLGFGGPSSRCSSTGRPSGQGSASSPTRVDSSACAAYSVPIVRRSKSEPKSVFTAERIAGRLR